MPSQTKTTLTTQLLVQSGPVMPTVWFQLELVPNQTVATLVATSGSHYTGVLIALEIDFCAVSVYTPPIFSILCIAFRYVSYSYYFDMYLMVASDMEWKLF